MTSINQVEASNNTNNEHEILDPDMDHDEGNSQENDDAIDMNDNNDDDEEEEYDDDELYDDDDDLFDNEDDDDFVDDDDDDNDDDDDDSIDSIMNNIIQRNDVYDNGKMNICMYAIKVAIENKKLEMISDLIDTCRSHYVNRSIISYQDKNGNSILHYACEIKKDDVNTLKYILHMLNNTYNVKVNTKDIIDARNFENDTILHVACHHGHKQILEYIIEHFQIDNTMLTTSYNSKGRSPFHMACSKFDILQYYIQTCHIDVDTKDRLGNTILHCASLYYQVDIIHYLRTVCHANEHALNNENETALPYGYDYHQAAINGNINLVMQCVQSGIDIDATNSYGYTALQLACRYGNCDIVEYLVAKCHVNVTTLNVDGSNAYHIACQYGHLDIVVYLLQQNHINDVDMKDKHGDTPLHIACKRRQSKIVQYLIENCHANINAHNRQGETILHCVVIRSKVELLKYLVNKCPKINVNVQDIDGATPLHIACRFGRMDRVQCLIKGIYTKDINVNLKAKDGYTPLLLAMQFGKLSTVQYIIQECCDTVDLTATTNKGFDVVDLAVKANKCNDFVLFMIQTFSGTTN